MGGEGGGEGGEVMMPWVLSSSEGICAWTESQHCQTSVGLNLQTIERRLATAWQYFKPVEEKNGIRESFSLEQVENQAQKTEHGK